MRAKEFVPASKPRNFVAKNQKTAGAGAHRDKKKEQKLGYEKHKGKGVAEGFDNPKLEARVRARLQQLQDVDPDNMYKIVAAEFGMSEDELRNALYDGSMEERVRDPEDWDEGNTEPPNNFAIYINGKKWKVFQGRGTYADDEREMKQYYDLKAWCQKKSIATGKKWEVSRTGEPATA